MLPIEVKVKECFDLSRAFFRDGAKADNKAYDPSINPGKAAREYDRLLGSHVLHGVRDMTTDYAMVGQVMRATGNTFGNCFEATSLAAAYVAEKMAGESMIVADSNGVDHVFLMVGSAVPSIARTVGEWSGMPGCGGQSYVIDVWAGVCCQTDEYPARLAAKMQKWQQQGKHIVVRPDRNTDELGTVKPVEFSNSLLGSGVRYVPINPNVNLVAKRRVVQTLERKRTRATSTATDRQWVAGHKLQLAHKAQERVEARIQAFVSATKAAPSEPMKAELQAMQAKVQEATDQVRLHTKELFYLQLQDDKRRRRAPAFQAVLQRGPRAAVASSSEAAPQPPQRSDRPLAEQRANDGAPNNHGRSSVRR